MLNGAKGNGEAEISPSSATTTLSPLLDEIFHLPLLG